MGQTSQVIVRPSRARVSLRSTLRTTAAGRLLATYWGSVLVVDLTRPTGRAVTLVALAGLVAVCSVHQRVRIGLGLGVVAWLFATGFVVNAYGDLVLHGPADAVRLILLTAVAALAALLTSSSGGRR